jgi:mitogen-activated protein kinase kinase 1 interacting protein 1
MSDDAKRYFTGLLNKVNGLKYILIHDRDGIILLKLAKDSSAALQTRQPFLSTFAVASEQASKMGSGKNKNIISIFNSIQVRFSGDLLFSFTKNLRFF